MTTLVIGGGELEKGRERTRWVRTRLGAKPASTIGKVQRNVTGCKREGTGDERERVEAPCLLIFPYDLLFTYAITRVPYYE